MLAVDLREPRAQRIGPYEVLLDIGSGGMGTISLARATGDELGVGGFARLVALKRPLGTLASDPEVLQRFLDEARLLAQVHHANVVGIHQIGSDAEGHFLVLDYIEGGTLDEMLTRGVLHRKKLPPPVVLRILSEVLAGLHAVHEAADVEGRPLHMLHRDVSAQNVLVGRDGVSRIADFGIAKAIVSSTLNDRMYLQGRVPYMAPEYLLREAVDQRLDVYAAGLTMWTALAGHLPWGDAEESQIVKRIVYDGVPPLSASGVEIAPAIAEIVARACHRDPSKRFATAREMHVAIESLGRKMGWIASHAEVAAVVQELLGMEIRERRTAIARRLATREGHGVASDRFRAQLASAVERHGASSDRTPPPSSDPSGVQVSLELPPPPPPPGAGVVALGRLQDTLLAAHAAPAPLETRVPSGPAFDTPSSVTPSARSIMASRDDLSGSRGGRRSQALLIGAIALAVAGAGAVAWRWGRPPADLVAPAPVGTPGAWQPSRALGAPDPGPPVPGGATVLATASAEPSGSAVRPGVPGNARPPRPAGSPAPVPTGSRTNNPYR